MKKYITLIMLMGALIPAGAQAQTLSLDSCRAMALRNNKQLNASKLKKDVAYNMKKSARTKYLPKVDALGGYEWFSREISLLNDGQKSTFSNIGSTVTGGISGGASNLMSQLVSQGMITPEIAQQIGGLLNEKLGPLQQQGNALGEKLVDAFRTDTRNIWAGSVMVRQPIYMGGAIIAANKIADIGEQIAENDLDQQTQSTLYSIDQAYWLAVSLKQKQKLAISYRDLVKKLNGLFQKILHYIHSALRSLGVVGSHTLLLLAGSVLRHVILTSGSSHLSLCSLISSVSLVAFLTADYALVEEVLHAVVGFLGDGCGSFSLPNQLESTLNLLLTCTCIRQVLHSLGCSVGSLEHLFLRFHFRHNVDASYDLPFRLQIGISYLN